VKSVPSSIQNFSRKGPIPFDPVRAKCSAPNPYCESAEQQQKRAPKGVAPRGLLKSQKAPEKPSKSAETEEEAADPQGAHESIQASTSAIRKRQIFCERVNSAPPLTEREFQVTLGGLTTWPLRSGLWRRSRLFCLGLRGIGLLQVLSPRRNGWLIASEELQIVFPTLVRIAEDSPRFRKIEES
jgi:hypothetical protein